MPKRKHSKEQKEQHENKVCNFSPDSKSEELKLLIQNPAYVCGDCGRSAASQESLCRPERMFSSW